MKNLDKGKKDKSTKKKDPVWWKILKKQAKEFCLATGLHGYKYIAQSQRSNIERVIWAIAVFASLSCAIASMTIAWHHYATHPTLTVIESTHHGIWNYPFPAVTICNINRVSLSMAQNFVQNLKLPHDISPEFVVQELRLLTEFLDPGLFEYDITENVTRLQKIIDNNGFSINDVVKLTTPLCTNFIRSCKWKGELFPCDELFVSSLSRQGICCSFNYFALDNDTESDKSDEYVTFKPRRLTACGYQTGLTVLINFSPADYHATILGSYGVNVLIHDPFDYPDYNAESKLVGLGTQALLSVEPEVTYSTPGVRDLPITTRNCIFSDEGDRIGFESGPRRNTSLTRYSYLNCMAECRATIVKQKCGCIPYYIPQVGTRVCNFSDITCLRAYRHWYESSWPGPPLDNSTLKMMGKKDSTKRPCGCIPDCNLYRYPTETSSGVLDENIYFSDGSFSKSPSEGESLQNDSSVHVYFNDLVGIQFRRNVHYNWRNLFASFGGLLGLFAGFSLMSGFELVYFFVIRVVTDAVMRKEKNNA